MNCTIEFNKVVATFSLSQKIPCFYSLVNGENNPRCFYLPYPTFEPFRIGNFVGSVAEGGAANCMVVTVAPHGSGTHTECIGHIAEGDYSVSATLTQSFFMGYFASVGVEAVENDLVVSHTDVENQLSNLKTDVTCLLLHINGRFNTDNSGTNPPYFLAKTMELIVERGIEHLIVNTPSVDKEEDGGALESHHIFWNYQRNGIPRLGATITELANFPHGLKDSLYIVEIQVAPIHSDASPSRIFLYPIDELATTDSK
jgi:arylformamidase